MGMTGMTQSVGILRAPNITASVALPSDVIWLGNSVVAWVGALIGAVIGFVVVHFAVRGVLRLIAPRAQRTNALRASTAALRGVRSWLVLAIAVVVALGALTFTARIDYWLHLVGFALIGVQLAICVNRALVALLLRAVPEDRPIPVMLHIVTWAVQLLVWITFALAVLTNAGVHITAFVASLGVGGIAIALALQNILGDLFASVAIGLDKPFEPGEFIMFGENLGTVQKVGVKTTRIASLSGEELAIGNAQLLGQLTHNYSRMPERRVVFGFTVPYSTRSDQLSAITARTREIIGGVDQVRFDRGHFTGFGVDGFTFEFVYYVLSSDYTLYRDIQQRINHKIIGILESLGVTFAVPARAVVVAAGTAAATPEPPEREPGSTAS